MARGRSPSPSEYSYSSYSSDARKPAAPAKQGTATQKAVAESNGNKKAKVKDTQPRSEPAAKAEPQVDASKASLDNLQVMLAARQREWTQEPNPDRKKDIEKDMEVLKQWIKDKKAPNAGSKAPSSGDAGKAKEKKAAKETKDAKAEVKKAKEKEEKVKEKMKESKEKGKDKKAEDAAKSKKAESEKTKKVPLEAKQSKPDKDSKKRLKEKEGKEQTAEAKKEEKPAKAPKVEKQKAAPAETSEAKKKPEESKEVKKLLQGAELIEQTKEALRNLSRQKAVEVGELEEEGEMQALYQADVTVLMPSGKVPPIQLPLWCVMPNPHDVETIFEVVRNISGSTAPPKRVQLGRRAWALLGRRLHDAQIAEARKAGVPEPEIGLACPLSSKAHAMIMQNWTGKIFIQDLGSTHGTFMNGVRLKPHEPYEWTTGAQVYFGNAELESFELRPHQPPRFELRAAQ